MTCLHHTTEWNSFLVFVRLCFGQYLMSHTSCLMPHTSRDMCDTNIMKNYSIHHIFGCCSRLTNLKIRVNWNILDMLRILFHTKHDVCDI